MIEDVAELPENIHVQLFADGSLVLLAGDSGIQFTLEQAHQLGIWLNHCLHATGPCFECSEQAPVNTGYVYHLAQGDVLLCQRCHEQRQETMNTLLEIVIE